MRRTLMLLAGGLLAAAVPGRAQTVLATAPVSLPGAGPPDPAVVNYAEQMPEFPGGDKAFRRYLSTKTRYLPEAERLTLSGTVVVRFVVDEQGRIRDAEVLKGVGAGLDSEALRLVRLMPRWTPGRQHGQPVRAARTLPISFRLR
jgi:protein TonB